MPKAKTIDRVALTLKNSPLLQRSKENSPFIKMRNEYMREHPEEFQNEHICPVCGGEVVPYECCYRCKKCGWSKC